jgi:acetyl esterase
MSSFQTTTEGVAAAHGQPVAGENMNTQRLLTRFAGGVVRTMAALPPGVQRWLTPSGLSPKDGQQLEPEVGMALGLLGLGGDSFENFPPPKAREMVRQEALIFAGAMIPLRSVEDRSIPGPGGEIAVRIYRDRPVEEANPTPLVVYLHGGGWVVADLETHDPFCRFLARELGFPVLAVDYRLAPESPFPAAVDDAVAAFEWAVEQSSELGVDPARIAVAGDSAGGNLSAVVSQVTVAAGGPAPAMQALIYPVTDLSTKRHSYQLFAEGYFLTEAQMDWYRGHYVDDAGVEDPRVSPLLADDLSALPPAYVATAGFDVLRDEGEAYARRLEEAGVPTTLRRHPGMVHGWVNAVSLGRSPRSAADELVAALRSGLTRTR